MFRLCAQTWSTTDNDAAWRNPRDLKKRNVFFLRLSSVNLLARKKIELNLKNVFRTVAVEGHARFVEGMAAKGCGRRATLYGTAFHE